MPQTLIDQVERWAASNEASRSEAIQRLVELWLKAKGK
jgi:metal-responsive CopG/Arc/MetJ family transcriptional regulator